MTSLDDDAFDKNAFPIP